MRSRKGRLPASRAALGLLGPLLLGLVMGLLPLATRSGLDRVLALQQAGHPRAAAAVAAVVQAIAPDPDVRAGAAVELARIRASDPRLADPVGPWEQVIAHWPAHPATADAWRALAAQPWRSEAERAAFLGAAAVLSGRPEDWVASARSWWAAGERDQARAAWMRAGTDQARYEWALAELAAGDEARAYELFQDLAATQGRGSVARRGLEIVRRRLSGTALADAADR